jgi:hypothetical protein
MLQQSVKPGDLVFSVEDRALGVVAAVSERTLTVMGRDGQRARLWRTDIYTVEHNRVTMVFSSGPLCERDIAVNRHGAG